MPAALLTKFRLEKLKITKIKFVNFFDQNFVRVADGIGILDEFWSHLVSPVGFMEQKALTTERIYDTFVTQLGFNLPTINQDLDGSILDYLTAWLFNRILRHHTTELSSNQTILKFTHSEKATKFSEIFTLLLTTVYTVKSKVKISQNFVAFSEYMNYILLCLFSRKAFEEDVPDK